MAKGVKPELKLLILLHPRNSHFALNLPTIQQRLFGTSTRTHPLRFELPEDKTRPARPERAEGQKHGEDGRDQPLREHHVAHHAAADAEQHARLCQQRDLVVDHRPGAPQLAADGGDRAAGDHERRVGGGGFEVQAGYGGENRHEEAAAADSAGAGDRGGGGGEDPGEEESRAWYRDPARELSRIFAQTRAGRVGGSVGGDWAGTGSGRV
ncbi:cytochrome P450 [Striga asiatica]|uniref:Cytochrome P450 n=1 Tax=Striga asiatica TaxID=4170 RepID=A0A5A7RGC3_STRAF|nr:cytochrome P450 [Striga asiatica]